MGRLHADSEMIAMTAAGIGELQVAKVVLLLSLMVAVLVSALSLVVRPWAYEQRYLLQTYAEANFEIENVEGRRFYVGPDSRYAAYVDSVDPSQRSARKVMFQTKRGDKLRIILADQMYQPARLATEPVTLVFVAGHAYQLDGEGSRDVSLNFERLVLRVAGSEPEDPSHKSKMRGTLDLRGSDDRKDLAEYQWRLSTPVTTVLLALLAVPLSRSTPRQGRHLREVLALLAYAIFYNLITMAKNLVQEGVVGAFPGLWWPIALLALSILAALAWPWRGLLVRRR
jgi:lipopolysaccharide export system permease protein